MATQFQERMETQLREIARNLLKKTQAGEVNWVRGENAARKKSFEVVLPPTRVVISHLNPIADPDALRLEIQDALNIPVMELTVAEPDFEQPDREDQERMPDWKLLSELFEIAHLTATGYDRVLKSIEAALATPGVIGTPALSATVSVGPVKLNVNVPPATATGTGKPPR